MVQSVLEPSSVFPKVLSGCCYGSKMVIEVFPEDTNSQIIALGCV